MSDLLKRMKHWLQYPRLSSGDVAELAQLFAEIKRLRAHNEQLWLYVAEQCCECYDEYGDQRPEECHRCRLMRAAKAGGDDE